MPPLKEIKPLLCNIYNAPDNIAAIRKELFEVEQTITLSAEQYNSYWPYVDNIWSSKGTPRNTKEGTIVEYFRCRCHPVKEHVPENEGRRKRQKSSHDALGCEMRIRVVKSLNIVTIDRTGKCLCHIHTLEDIDLRKRPSTFRDLAAIEVAKNYTVAEVARNLRAVDRPDDRKLLTDAGGWHLSLKDVHNASATWKKDHPNNKRQGNLSGWEEQRLETQEWLESEHWHVENIEVCY